MFFRAYVELGGWGWGWGWGYRKRWLFIFFPKTVLD